MSASGGRRLPAWIGAGIAAACWAVLALLQSAGAFEVAELRLLDWRFRLRGAHAASDSIAIVEVDDATIQAYQRWPLPRETYAVLLTALSESGACATGVDLQFLGENLDDHMADLLLAEVSKRSRRVVHAFSFPSDDPSLGGASGLPGEYASLASHGVGGSAARLPTATRASLPFGALLDASRALGHVSVITDRDGVVRRIPQLVRYGERLYPSLTLRLVLAGRGRGLPERVTRDRGRLELAWTGTEPLRLPVGREGATAIDFAGDRESFAHRWSMLDVLGWYRDNDSTRLREAFAGRYVLVGATAVAQAMTDLGPTPFESATPLLYVHANALDGAIRQRFLRDVSGWVLQPLLLLLALALGVSFSRLSPGRSLVALGGAVVLVALSSLGLLAFASAVMPTTGALVLPPVAYAAIESWKLVFLERHARARDREMNLARKIQQGLLPKAPPNLPSLEVFGTNIPAQEVGGDYFDWLALADGSLLATLGDVSGKGVGASLLMSHLHASFHASAQGTDAPVEIVRAMHVSLCRAVQPGKFATLFLARLDPAARRIRYCNAGHNPGFVVRGAEIESLGPCGIPLGMIEASPYEEAAAAFGPGDVLVLYSDGVTECPYKTDLYGEERFQALLRRLVREGASTAKMGEAILADLRAYAHGDSDADDITLLIVRHTGAA